MSKKQTKNMKALIFDIDGVITDGKQYIDSQGNEIKSVSFKDLDAFSLLKDKGLKLGCFTGEDTPFCRRLAEMDVFDYIKLGCKRKEDALNEFENIYRITDAEICYIGDGKYDVPVLNRAGMAVCPNDAIEEVKSVSDIILERKGGEGCIAELYTILSRKSQPQIVQDGHADKILDKLYNRLDEHIAVMNNVKNSNDYVSNIETAIRMIIACYENSGRIFLCGNGGSAADAQHLAAELVGRFCLERKALDAEALSVNTSVLTSLANDYNYNMVFARQLEAKAKEGDILIGITTSGTAENVLQAFQKATEMKVKTVLMTGMISDYLPILNYTDCLLRVPSKITPRIQEVHILTGHVICEIVEKELADRGII